MNVGRAVFGRTLAAVYVGLVVGCGGGGYGGGGGGEPAATQTISVAPATITLGQSATLTWSSNPGTDLQGERRVERHESREWQ